MSRDSSGWAKYGRRLWFKIRLNFGVSRLLCLMVCIVCILMMIKSLYPSRHFLLSDDAYMNQLQQIEAVDPKDLHDRWIVVTTIHDPTPSLRALAAIPGWRMVVIGDVDSPPSWKLPGIVYLDMEKQKSLPYAVLDHLPYGSPTRKIIGYLYAIQHGASAIYDTDDDNMPITDLCMHHMHSPIQAMLLASKNISYNVFDHFGQSTMWPRGYPLEHLGRPVPRQYRLCEMNAPMVQQTLAESDPDVDSIVRLTRKGATENMDIHFDMEAPPLVAQAGTYISLNSQSTLFRYNAFWGLVFPVSATSRTTDIYRGYWLQRLLWMLGEHAGCYPPGVRHDRNQHNYLNDAMEEYDLLKMGRLMQVMNKWECTDDHFFSCISQLTKLLVEEHFWRESDVQLIEAWLEDLSRIGYIPPMKRVPLISCSDPHIELYPITFFPHEMKTSMLVTKDLFHVPASTNLGSVQNFVSSLCKKPIQDPSKYATFTDILLIIKLESDIQSMPVIEAWYRPYFRNIIYCVKPGQVHLPFMQDWQISYLTVHEKHSHIACVYQAMRMGYNVSGYLFVPENALVNPKALANHDKNTFWVGYWQVSDEANLNACKKGQLHCVPFKPPSASSKKYLTKMDSSKVNQKLDIKIKMCFSKLETVPAMQTDLYYYEDIIVYFPKRVTPVFEHLFYIYLQVPDFEMLPVLILECLEMSPTYLNAEKDISNYADDNVDLIFPYDPRAVLQKHTAVNSMHTHFCENVRL